MSTHSFAALIYFSCDAFLFNLRCQTCYWGNVCAEEAFTFQLCFCVAWSCLCGRETWSLPQKTPDPALSRVMGLLFMFFACLAPCICLCLSDPPVTPSPASRPPTPYQTRERTRDARMYHSHQFCFGFTAADWWGKVSLCLLEYTLWCSSVGNLILRHVFSTFEEEPINMWQNTLCTVCCVLWNCAGSDLCFPSSWASLSIIVLQ